MKPIQKRNVYIYIIGVVDFVIFLFMGFWRWQFFIPAAAIGLGSTWFDKKYLRCPNCNAFINADQLLYAEKHTYYCYKCGKAVKIE